MRAVIVMSAAAVALALTTSASAGTLSADEQTRIQEAATVLHEIHAVPDKDIPQELWEKAQCVVVIPSLKKAAFVFGGEYGKGLMSCREGNHWSAPVFMEMEKGSWGFQIGAQSVDLVLLAMNQDGVNKLLKDKVSLGAEASVAAGPVGRDARAATDAQLKAEILSYSRTQGLFAGIDVSGGALMPDTDENADLYGKNVSPVDVVTGRAVRTVPVAAESFITALRREGPVATSGKK
jgi:SH3 domain-containing YSC84-like protein 1